MPAATDRALRREAEIHRFPAARICDADLVQGVARGDDASVREVWVRHSGAVRRALHRQLPSAADVDDLLQEVFVAFVRQAAAIAEPSALRAYLVGLAVRRALQARRSAGRRRRWTELFGLEAPRRSEARVEGRDALRALHRVLDGLSDELRLAFSLRYVEDLQLADVARALDASEATAKRVLARARARVARAARAEPALADYVTPPDEGEATP